MSKKNRILIITNKNYRSRALRYNQVWLYIRWNIFFDSTYKLTCKPKTSSTSNLLTENFGIGFSNCFAKILVSVSDLFLVTAKFQFRSFTSLIAFIRSLIKNFGEESVWFWRAQTEKANEIITFERVFWFRLRAKIFFLFFLCWTFSGSEMQKQN